MKTIGLIGGLSWESTVSYYQGINELVKQKLGGLNSAKILLYSVNFEEIEKMQLLGKWNEAGELLGNAAQAVQLGGADFLLICSNTMYKVADQVEADISIPLVHIADPTAAALQASGISRVGLLGTKYTMEEDFYASRLATKFGIEILIPDATQRETVHNVIYNELCRGIIREGSRADYLDIIASLQSRGAEAVILGCTEIALLVKEEHTHVPLFDTTQLHVHKAVELALSE